MMVLAAFVLSPLVPPQLPLLHEESFLASSQSDCWVFGSGIQLDGDRLVFNSIIGNEFGDTHMFRREGDAWVSEDAGLGGWVMGFDNDRYVTGYVEDRASSVYRRVGGTWEKEQDFYLPRGGGGWIRLHGDLLATTDQYVAPWPWTAGVTIWKRGTHRWLQEALILPDAPQASLSCCYPFDLFGNTLAFTARSASGSQSIQIHVRTNGQWQKEAELSLAPDTDYVQGLDIDGDTLVVLVQGSRLVHGSTAFVFEREGGAWRETAQLFPGQLATFVLEGDTLVLGQGAGPYQQSDIPSCAFVVQRENGAWVPTHELRASDGWPLGHSLAIEGSTVAVASHWDRPRLGRTYLFRLPVRARVETYGCGVNPPGSLVVLAGRPAVGETLTLGLGNPLGTQAAGTIGHLVFADHPSLEYPCGRRMGGLGMDGGAGEWLLRRVPPLSASARPVGMLADPAQLLEVELAIPADPGLIGRRVYVQGALRDPRRGAAVRWGVTTALELTIGL